MDRLESCEKCANLLLRLKINFLAPLTQLWKDNYSSKWRIEHLPTKEETSKDNSEMKELEIKIPIVQWTFSEGRDDIRVHQIRRVQLVIHRSYSAGKLHSVRKSNPVIFPGAPCLELRSWKSYLLIFIFCFEYFADGTSRLKDSAVWLRVWASVPYAIARSHLM